MNHYLPTLIVYSIGETNDLRIEVVTNRSQETLKIIIENHIGIGNYIVTDS